MDVFNKFYSQVTNSVSSTVSQLSGVLPGNPVTREFDSLTHIASAGPGLLWKVYKGTNRTTKNEAAVFVFEKRQLERYNKNDRDIILESLRRGVQQLTKIRHPQILTVQHPLEESRESLAFATEPIFASLANIMGETNNMPQPSNISDYKFYDIEIKYGLLQLAEGLTFLHNDVKMIHRNICPESIIVNSSGVWKIFGLDFCALLNSSNTCEYNPVLPNVCQPNLNYLAPECGSSITSTPNPVLSSDMFSLGMLVYALYATDRQPLMPVRDLQQFRQRKFQNLTLNRLQCIPAELRDFVKLLLDVRPDLRPDAHQFIKIPFFEDIGIKTLTYLDSLLQWDNIQKSQFYKGLPAALTKLPHRVKLRRVLTCLTRDLAQPVMVPFILPSIFDIAKNCDGPEYCEYVLPHLRPLMKIIDPIQVLLIMLQNMELLLKLTPANDIQLHVLPMLYRGLDSDSVQIHELCLTVLPTFASLLDHSNVKNSLLPRIKRLCLSTSSLSVRVNCLLCIGKLLEHLDKWLVLDEILSFLPQIPSREPAVLMGIIGIYKIALTHKKLGITKEIIASRVLPFLIPLCIENSLTIPQFNTITSLIKEMFNNVEVEHRQKLEQLNSVKDEQKTLVSSMNTSFDAVKTPDLSDWVIPPADTRGNTVQKDNLKSNIDILTPPVSKVSSLSPPMSTVKSSMSNGSNFSLQPSIVTNSLAQKTNVSSPLSTGNFSSQLTSPQMSNKNNSLSNNFPTQMSNIPTFPPHMSNFSNSLANNNFPQLSNNTSFPPQMSNMSSMESQMSNIANWASPVSKNESSFDKLLASNTSSHRSGNSQMSMNQMMLMQPQNVKVDNRMRSSSKNTGHTKLSNDEIMDLLS